LKSKSTAERPEEQDSGDDDEQLDEQEKLSLSKAYVKRMFRVFDEKNYEDESRSKDMQEGRVEANRNAATLVLTVLLKLYNAALPHLEQIQTFLAKKQYGKVGGTAIKRAYVLCARSYIADFVLYIAMTTPATDVFYQEVSSEDWQALLGIFEYHDFGNTRKLVKAYDSFQDFIAVGHAMMSRQDVTENAFLRTLKKGFYGLHYLVQKEKRRSQKDMVAMNPDISQTQELWNMMERPFILKSMETLMPKIKINKSLYIPMLDTVLTRENVG